MNPLYAPVEHVPGITKKHIVQFLFYRFSVVLITVCLTCTLAKSQAQQNKYNVLLISIDDMNNKIGYLGYPAVLTPNIQRLLNRGVGFTSAFCQFSICNPSRISMMSGWRPDKTKVVSNDNDPREKVPANVQYLQDYFHSFGYRTERYGKIYHEQFEYEFAWDYFENYKDSSGSDRQNSAAEASGSHENLWGINPPDKFTNPDSSMAAHLVASLRTPSAVPRFFGFGLISPHAPFVPPIASWNKYGNADTQVSLPYIGSKKNTVLGNSAHNIALPQPPANDRDDIPEMAFYRTNTIVFEDSAWKNTIQAYYAEVTLMDANLGIVLDELDRQNLWDNTVVILVSDHGQHLGEHQGLWYKNTLFNEAQQVPMIICAPGKQSGISNKLVEEVDIYPTLTELCRLPTPAGMEGASVVRLLDDPTQTWKRAAFTQTKNNGTLYSLLAKPQAVFSNRYHYNYWGIYGEELYDRVDDHNEYTNLVNNPAYTTILDSMRTIRSEGWEKSLPPPCDSAIYYADKDEDGYGSATNTFKGCYQPFGYIINPGDCNDTSALIHPDAQEVCDGIDNNCNGLTDENAITATVTPSGAVTVCTGQSLLLTASTGTNISYQWLKNNNAIAGATNPTFTVTKSGNYSVRESLPRGCIATSPVTAATYVSKPDAFIFPLSDLNICSSGSVSLLANFGAGYTYQWKKGSSYISGATGIQYTATAIGTYFVIVTDGNNCSKQSIGTKVFKACFASAGNSFSGNKIQVSIQTALQLFPNPSNGKTTASFYSDHTGNMQFKVFDITGKCLYTKTVQSVKGSNSVLLDPGTISAGMYYLTLTGNQSSETIPFIVNK